MTRARDTRAATDAALAALEVEITPEPTPAEREAIFVALKAMLSTRAGTAGGAISPWARAGRREALFREPSSGPAAWGRGRDRAARW